MAKIIALMGAPGAGKGTQARLLQERLNLPQISTGDMFRALAESHTPLAQEVRETQAAGKLIPDDLVIRVVQERTRRGDCKRGYVLDGFPRTIAQANMLEKLAVDQEKHIIAIVVDVPSELLEKRALGRRTCPVCGELYNMYFKPPLNDERCDLHPEAMLIRRLDDTAEKIKVRLATYEEQTRPLVDYYQSSGRLYRVDGTQNAEAIFHEIERIISGNDLAR
jgi:adenylate kinase